MKQWCLIIYFLPVLLGAKELDIFGYFEPQYMGAELNGNFFNVASNKLRLDLVKDISNNVSFGANFNYITFHGKTEWNLVDYLPRNISENIPESIYDYFTFHFGDMATWNGVAPQQRPDRIFLDNACIKLSYKKADITLGKQQMGMGTGYTWNPTDLFNTKDILDPTYEQPGHNAVRFDYSINSKLRINSYLSFGEKWDNSGAMLKLKGTMGHFDLSVLGIHKYWQRTNYSNFMDPPSLYQRWMVGGDFVGELFGLGLWGEGGYTFTELKQGPGLNSMQNFYEMVLGADYTFSSSLYVMGEIYYNSFMPNKWQDYTLNSWIWYFSSDAKSICRENFFGLVQYPATDLLTVGMMVIASLTDGSAAIAPMLTWNVFQDVDLLMYINYFTGQDGRAFAKNVGNGGLVRVRVYF